METNAPSDDTVTIVGKAVEPVTNMEFLLILQQRIERCESKVHINEIVSIAEALSLSKRLDKLEERTLNLIAAMDTQQENIELLLTFLTKDIP